MNAVLVDSAQLIAAALILALSIVCFLHKRVKSVQKKAVLPPGPRGLPIVGYLPFLRRDLHRQFTELAAAHGPIYKLRLGSKSKLCTVISSASLAKELFRDNDTVFANHGVSVAATIISLNFNDISFAPYGPEWRNRRKILLREMLSNTNLQASCNLRKDQVRDMVKEIYAEKIGKPVNIFDLALRIDLNLIINMIWGGKITVEQRDRISAGLTPIVAEIQDFLMRPNISDFFPVLARFDVQGIARDLTTLLKKFEAIMEEAIDERIKNPCAAEEEEARKDFMQTLVDHWQDEDINKSIFFESIPSSSVHLHPYSFFGRN